MSNKECPSCGAACIESSGLLYDDGGLKHHPVGGVRCLTRQRDRLQSIVDKVRKTDDGVPITEGMVIFGHMGDHPNSDAIFVCQGYARMSVRFGGKDGKLPPNGYGWTYAGEGMYSTSASAEETKSKT